MPTVPPSIETLPFVDLIPSPALSILIIPFLIVTDFLPLTASAEAVLILTVPPLNLRSLLQ